MLWALTMPPLYEELVVDRKWTGAQFLDRVLTVARRTLLAEESGPGRER